MFGALPPQPEDKIFAMLAAFQSDPRPGKLDLSVGVYRDETGATPVMACVKAAEAINHAEEMTKTYNRFIGDASYLAAVERLAFVEGIDRGRISSCQTPGGTGALNILLQLAASAHADMTVWLPQPTWPNHPAILTHLGIPIRSVPYYDAEKGTSDIEAFLSGLDGIAAGDVVVLHASCHNPTGADFKTSDWKALAEHAQTHGWVPLIDMAYQGFGAGIEEDAAGLRHMASVLPEVMAAVSFSKSMGLYRDRAGAALVVSAPENQSLLSAALAGLNRLTYSFAPHPAAAIVARILSEPARHAAWQAELDAMRMRIVSLRLGLADALRRETNSDHFDAIAGQQGMFSLLPLPADDIAQLRKEHGIYILGDGRMNIAGLPAHTIEHLARAIAEVSNVS